MTTGRTLGTLRGIPFPPRDKSHMYLSRAHDEDPAGMGSHRDRLDGFPGAHRSMSDVEVQRAIRRRAFAIYMERMELGMEGSAESDWLTAERSLFESMEQTLHS